MTAQDYIRMNFRHLTPKSGLSSIYVRKVLQDPFGFMWIGTEDGLNRYDGRNVTVYNKGLTGKHQLTGEDTRDLLTDTLHHLIWEINSFGGIDAIDYISQNVVYRYRQSDAKSTADVVFNSLALSGHQLYIGSTHGLYVLDTDTRQLRVVSLMSPLPHDDAALSIDQLLRDSRHRLWLFCHGGGVVLLSELSLTLLGSLPGGEGQLRFYDGIEQRNGSILAATSSGLRAFSSTPQGAPVALADPFAEIPSAHGRDVYSCRQDRHGIIWFCTAGSLVRTDPEGRHFELVREHTSRDDNCLDAVYHIYFDRDDYLWLGCQAGLSFAPNAPSCFTAITGSTLSSTAIRHAYAINPESDSTLYCCAQDGLYCVNPVKGGITTLDGARPYYLAFLDPHRRLVVANIDGAFVLRGGRLVNIATVYPEFRNMKKMVLNSRAYVGDSLIVFGTQNEVGLVAWNYRMGRVRIVDRHTPDLWLKENRVSYVYTDRRGLVWALGDRSVSILDLRRHTVHSLNTYNSAGNKQYSLFFDVCESGGRYFLAAYGTGVLVLDSNFRFMREITPREGLAAGSVYKLIPYKDSLLFVTTNNGLSVIRLRTQTVAANYYESDGLHSDNFEEYSGAIRDNIIYVGGANGLTVIDPSLFRALPAPPPVYIRQVKTETPAGISDTSNLLLPSLDIPEDAVQTTVYFSAVNYQSPGRTRLAYRIRELGGGWIDIGNQDFVPLIGLNPGSYTLEVRSANPKGGWNDHPTELSLQFLPKWYQTLLFKLLVAAAVASLLYAAYRYRIHQLQRQQQIRKDIATDLHDDIGSTLNTVKIFTHLARREQHREEYLSRIEESLLQASAGLRDMIWVLDESEDTVRELADRIRKFAVPVTQAKGIELEVQLGEGVTDRRMTKTVKRNLLLIAKETVNNSLKYSGCQRILVSLEQGTGGLVLVIRDDGKGFDVDAPAPGNGLRNIYHRAKQIKFAARIESKPGEGTMVEVREM
jgi:signal transduction histidine kinase/ligand-binding sensor domain-containing protein